MHAGSREGERTDGTAPELGGFGQYSPVTGQAQQ
jgi:hypothetical protein